MKKNFGFSLIELLVVISIIGVLAALIVANFAGIRERTRDTQRKSDLKQIQKALQMYYGDNQNYPAAGSFTFGSNWTVGGTTVYMSKVPQDPLYNETTGTPTYTYTVVGTTGDDYNLKATLENKSDKEINESQLRCGVATPDASSFILCAE